MNHQEIVTLLNDLIKTREYCECGFRYSAKHVRSAGLAMILVSLGDNCLQGAGELQKQLVQIGGYSSSRRRTSAALQRAWLALRSVFSGNATMTMLNECTRCEEAAVSRYEQALQKPVPDPLRELLERQLRGAQCNTRRIRDLMVLEQVIWPAGPRPIF